MHKQFQCWGGGAKEGGLDVWFYIFVVDKDIGLYVKDPFHLDRHFSMEGGRAL